jgi:NADH-quinone oxidoreductase subunit G
VCPTGALTPRPEVDEVWRALSDPAKTAVAQIAPAVRVALGEAFGLAPGTSSSGRMVAALKRLGFEKVYDTSFSADLTVVEEANEFLKRKAKGERLPQFTSCCPGWVKFAEQYFPELLPNLSTCKSPQQMLGAVCKQFLPEELGLARENLVVVSIMPCTAKKFEARRPEFAANGSPDVDYVLTTQELARMIEEAGLRFQELEPESYDMPLGFKTGAGVIFGNSGGVSEAVLRYAAEQVTGQKLKSPDFPAVRGADGLRLTTIAVGEVQLKLAVVHGLRNARTIAERVCRGECDLDLIEVMACPGGCVGGAGQPVTRDSQARHERTRGLYEADKNLDLHKSQENHFVSELYAKRLGEIGGRKAHQLLHTKYQNRRRIADERLLLGGAEEPARVEMNVCVGTNCFVKGSQGILRDLLEEVNERQLDDQVNVTAGFCFEKCERGPVMEVDGKRLEGCTGAKACAALREALEKARPAEGKAE